jgi:hypothetical protein
MQDPMPRLAVVARRLLSAIKGFEKAILGQVEAVTEATEAAKANQNVPPEVIVRAELNLPHGVEIRKSANDASDDKKYQSRTLWIGRLTFVVAVLTLFSLIVYACISARQLREMRRAAKATQEAADAAKSAADTASTSIRPWIKINTVELRESAGPIRTLMFHWFPTGAAVPPMIQVKVSVLNVGHSVAQNAQVISELFFGKFESDKWHDDVTKEEERFCASVPIRPPNGASKIVFPSEPAEWNMGIEGIIREGDAGSTVAASLILCVDYNGTPTPPYQTQAWFGLYQNNSVFINTELDADANNLRLIRDESGDHAN